MIIYKTTKYTNANSVFERLKSIFKNRKFINNLKKSDKNWTGKEINIVIENILSKM